MGLSPVSECSRRRSASKSINQARARAGARSLLLIFLTHKTSGRPNLVQCMLAGWLAGWRLHLDGEMSGYFCLCTLHCWFFLFLVFGLWQLESAGAPLSSGFFFPPTQTTVQFPNCFTLEAGKPQQQSHGRLRDLSGS